MARRVREHVIATPKPAMTVGSRLNFYPLRDMLLRTAAWLVLRSFEAARKLRGQQFPIRIANERRRLNSIEAYWGRHTVYTPPFLTSRQSIRHLERRFHDYPLLKELMFLHAGHEGETILEYGCGTGNDVVGFALHSCAARIIGLDVSLLALRLARHRISLHGVDSRKVSLICVSDSDPGIPLADSTIDYVYSEGVLHHTSQPERILSEFRRIMSPGAQAMLMVYNTDSVFRNLYVAYERQIRSGFLRSAPLDDAFARSTDGEHCPKALCFRAADFCALCETAGFTHVRYLGGFFNRQVELVRLKERIAVAVHDNRLPDAQRAFLAGLTFDARGYPLFQGRPAGYGGVYVMSKA